MSFSTLKWMPESQPHDGLRLLLDSHGVREFLILQQVMKIRQQLDDLPILCDRFDLIDSTSTGWITALMNSQLGVTLVEGVLSDVKQMNSKFKVSKFKMGKLEELIKRIIKDWTEDVGPDARMKSAGTGCKTSMCAVTCDLELCKEYRDGLLEKYHSQTQKFDDYRRAIGTAWGISIGKLRPKATTFLKLCAFLHRGGIPLAIFQEAIKIVGYVLSTEPGFLETVMAFLSFSQTASSLWDIQFLDLIVEIHLHSLIDKAVPVHPLAHEWTLTLVTNPIFAWACTKWLIGLSVEWTFKMEDYLFSQTLLPHNFALKGSMTASLSVAQYLALVYDGSGWWKTTGDYSHVPVKISFPNKKDRVWLSCGIHLVCFEMLQAGGVPQMNGPQELISRMPMHVQRAKYPMMRRLDVERTWNPTDHEVHQSPSLHRVSKIEDINVVSIDCCPVVCQQTVAARLANTLSLARVQSTFEHVLGVLFMGCNMPRMIKILAKGGKTTMAQGTIAVMLTCIRGVNAQLTDSSGVGNSAALSTVALSTTSAMSAVASVGMDIGWQIYTGIGSAAMFVTDMELAYHIAGALRSMADTTGSVYIRHRDRSKSVDGGILGWGIMAPAESLREAVYACLTSHQPHDRDLLGSVWMWVSTDREWSWICRPYVVKDSHMELVIDEIRNRMPSRTSTGILQTLKGNVFKHNNKDAIKELEEGNNTGVSTCENVSTGVSSAGRRKKKIIDAAKVCLLDRQEPNVLQGLHQMRRSITDGFPSRKDIKVRVVKKPFLVTMGVKAFDIYCLYEHNNRMATCLSLISVLPMLGLLVAVYGVNVIAANLALTAVIDYVACGKSERAENYARAGGYLHGWAKTQLNASAQRRGENAENVLTGRDESDEKRAETTTTRRMCKQAAYPGENAARFVLAQLPAAGSGEVGVQSAITSSTSRLLMAARILSFLIICGMPLVHAFLVKNWKDRGPRSIQELFFYPILAIGIPLASVGQMVALCWHKEPLVVREVRCDFHEYVRAWVGPQKRERDREWRVIDKAHLAERFLDANVFGSIEDAITVAVEFIRCKSPGENKNVDSRRIAFSVRNSTVAFTVACAVVLSLSLLSSSMAMWRIAAVYGADAGKGRPEDNARTRYLVGTYSAVLGMIILDILNTRQMRVSGLAGLVWAPLILSTAVGW